MPPSNTWTDGDTFNHTLYANCALTGAHATVTCAQCHTNNNYTNLPTACYSCHQADFTGTTNPAHVSAGFPTDCTICHSTTNWTYVDLQSRTTTFPLTGFHATMQCVQCHTSATTYNGSLPTLCYGCHMADWNGTTNPAHAAAGFPTTCDTCHTTTDWTGATFNHNNTTVPADRRPHHGGLQPVPHQQRTCGYTPTDCYSCHTADYNGTTNPNHTTARLADHLHHLPHDDALDLRRLCRPAITRSSRLTTVMRTACAPPATPIRPITRSSPAPAAMAATTRPTSITRT